MKTKNREDESSVEKPVSLLKRTLNLVGLVGIIGLLCALCTWTIYDAEKRVKKVKEKEEAIIARIFNNVDLNQDGRLSEEEYLRYAKSELIPRILSDTERAIELFKGRRTAVHTYFIHPRDSGFDFNKNGYLEPDEFRGFLDYISRLPNQKNDRKIS